MKFCKVVINFVCSFGAMCAACAAHAQGTDFLSQPSAACEWFAQQEMRASLAWSKPKADQPYWWCQYASQFGAATPFYVRAGRAVLDEKEKKVSVSLSIQAMGSDATREDAQRSLNEFTDAFFRAQGRSLVDNARQVVEGKSKTAKLANGVEAEAGAADLWEKHKVLGVSFSLPASAQLLAAAAKGPSVETQANEAALEKALGDRCDTAIRTSQFEDKPRADFSAYKRSGRKATEGQYVFDYTSASNGTYNCRVCDDLNPNINCGFVMGTQVAFQAVNGDNTRLPAELDRKCVSSLQSQLKNPNDARFVDTELVRKTRVDAAHTDKSYVFNLRVEGDSNRYRCVIRKNDLNYTLESTRDGTDWRGMVGGKMM